LTVTDPLPVLPFFVTVSVPYLFIEAARPPVIASEAKAKQSRIPRRRHSGLLRRFSAKLLRNFVTSSSQ
jgi:hypothetical protein